MCVCVCLFVCVCVSESLFLLVRPVSGEGAKNKYQNSDFLLARIPRSLNPNNNPMIGALRLVRDLADDFLKFSAKGEKKEKKGEKKKKEREKKGRRRKEKSQ